MVATFAEVLWIVRDGDWGSRDCLAGWIPFVALVGLHLRPIDRKESEAWRSGLN